MSTLKLALLSGFVFLPPSRFFLKRCVSLIRLVAPRGSFTPNLRQLLYGRVVIRKPKGIGGFLVVVLVWFLRHLVCLISHFFLSPIKGKLSVGFTGRLFG
jgi:hypothetical protein